MNKKDTAAQNNMKKPVNPPKTIVGKTLKVITTKIVKK